MLKDSYGKKIIPISGADEEALKENIERGIELIGSTDVSNIPINYYMEKIDMLLP